MVKKMTSKERIMKMAEEAVVGKEKKAEKKKKTTTDRKSTRLNSSH